MDGTEPRNFFSLRFLSHKLIYETKFYFLCELLTLYRQVFLIMFSYNCDTYLLITVHDRQLHVHTTATSCIMNLSHITRSSSKRS